MNKQLREVCQLCGFDEGVILHYIEEEWIVPVDTKQLLLDEEDVARLQLIHELTDDFGVNDEAIPIILHLIDQLNLLESFIKTEPKPRKIL